jgi:hypothetical protein
MQDDHAKEVHRMKPPPAGWPRLSSSAYYQDPARMIDWLCEAFGFELKIKVEGDDGGAIRAGAFTC